MITSKTYYGIEALAFLATKGRGNPLGIREIATERAIPRRFLEHIFSRMKNAKLVNATRGIGGGYRLAKSPGDISLAEIISVCEGTALLSSSAVAEHSGRLDAPISNVLSRIIKDQQSIIAENLNQITLTDLIQAAGLSAEMYWI